MIPRAHITAWRSQARWSTDAQVEQDLVLSRALVEIFSEPLLKERVAFRGGTALHKLYLTPPSRYSEDVDLVQIQAGPIGKVLNSIRSRLDPWLGVPQWKQAEDSVSLLYRFESEIAPVTALRLKVEINTREHFAVLGYASRSFVVESSWFRGAAELTTYDVHELLGTKLRALYQRRKGRDLYDLSVALERLPNLDAARTIQCFQYYLNQGGLRISRAEFEANMEEKMRSKTFKADIEPLLTPGASKYEPTEAYRRVHKTFIAQLPGEPWKGRIR